MANTKATSGDRIKISISVISLVLVFDQITKWWITQHFFDFGKPLAFWDWFFDFGAQRHPFDSTTITSFLNFVMVWNRGISFGFLGYSGEWMVWFLILLTVAIVVFLSGMILKTKSKFLITALSLVIGGALGNIWDRVRFGAVADFIDFHYAGWHYPAFNVADACITIGVVLYLIGGLLMKQEE